MSRSLSYILLGAGVFALSSSAIFVRIADAPSGIAAFYRLAIALIILIPITLVNQNRRIELFSIGRKQLFLLLSSGAILAIHYILWFESLEYTSVASSTVIVALQPVFALLISKFVLRDYYSRKSILGCVISVIGAFIIGYGDISVGYRAVFGDILALIAAITIAIYFTIGQKMRAELSASVYTLVGYTGSVIFLGVYSAIRGYKFTGYSVTTWGCFIGLAIVSTIMGQYIFNLLLRWLSATTISMGIIAEPVGTSMLAYFILNESIATRQLAGIAVIFTGLIIYLREVNKTS